MKASKTAVFIQL